MDQRRRKFIKNSAWFAGSMPMLSMLKYLPSFKSNLKSEIIIFNTNWGFSGTLEEFCRRSKEEGYDGIELWVPGDPEGRAELLALVQKYDLKLGLLAGNSGATVGENLERFKTAINNAVECQPTFINCHSGKDFYTFEQNQPFIEHTIAIEKESGIPINHETHRGRILFNAPTAHRFLKTYDELRMTLDISHWTVVHESLLQDQPDAIAMALDRTRHIHSRVGFQEAPQIPNPSSEHYGNAIKAHFAWWDQIVQKHAEKNETLTMTTEFGPPPYMWTSPETGEPLENVWDMNVMMLKMWRERYA